jgi:hypothetical protein
VKLGDEQRSFLSAKNAKGAKDAKIETGFFVLASFAPLAFFAIEKKLPTRSTPCETH